MIITHNINPSSPDFWNSNIIVIDPSILLSDHILATVNYIDDYMDKKPSAIIQISRFDFDLYNLLCDSKNSTALSCDEISRITSSKKHIRSLIRKFSPNRFLQDNVTTENIFYNKINKEDKVCFVTGNEVSLIRLLDQYSSASNFSYILCSEERYYCFNPEQAQQILTYSHLNSVSGISAVDSDKSTPWYYTYKNSVIRVAKNPSRSDIAKGSEGNIYHLHNGVVGKIFKNSVSSTRIEKIKFLANLPLEKCITKPEGMIYSDRSLNIPIGYTMREIRNHTSLSDLILPQVTTEFINKEFSNCSRGTLIRLAIDIVAKSFLLHHKGIMPCDYTPSNFMINTKNISAIFVDSDSYYVDVFPNTAKMDIEFPFSLSFSSPADAIKGEYASLLVMVFYILTIGVSPFFTNEAEKRTVFKFQCGLQVDPPFGGKRFWDMLPSYMQELFSQTFNNNDNIARSYYSSPNEILICLFRYLHEWKNDQLPIEHRGLEPL